jgi:hypothetical protein
MINGGQFEHRARFMKYMRIYAHLFDAMMPFRHNVGFEG